MTLKIDFNAPIVVRKQIYGYVIVSSLAVAISIIGVVIIYLEQRKLAEERSAGKIILGICIASLGSLIMLLTIFYLTMRL